MDIREFLAGVVPWDTGDYVNIHWLNLKSKHKGGMPGRSFTTIDQVLAAVEDCQRFKPGVEIYFCISSQRVSGERTIRNASYLCCLPFDFDIESGNPKKYASAEEAIDALIKFCAKYKIPKPSAVVMSGGGLHVYWWSTDYLTVEQWKPFALAMKAAALEFGLKIDPAVTGDAARVLRVPGTKNGKYDPPRPGELLDCGGDLYDFAIAFSGVMNLQLTPPSQGKIQMAEGFQHLDPNQKLGAGIESLPVPFTPIKKECSWLRTAFETGGRDYDQPQWHLTSLCATFMEDGENLIHKFGNQHPTYDPVQTDEMWDRKIKDRQEKNLGWPSCKTISENGAHEHCRVCPHLAKGKTPLHLGYAVAMEEIKDKEMKGLGGTRPEALRLPEGFCLNEAGKICAFIPTTAKKGKAIAGRLLQIVNNPIRDPSLQQCGDRPGISFVAATSKGTEMEIFLDASNVYRETGLLRSLPKNGVLYNPSPEAKIMAEKFFTSWLDKLKEEDVAIVRDPSMGWKHENGQHTGFVYGGKKYLENGMTAIVPQPIGDEEFYSWYMPTGAIEVWREAAKLITDRKTPALDTIIAAGFAAPLTVFTGAMYGAFLSIWGTPGSAKSTAQQISAAIWGHPKQTRESVNSTPKSVQGRLGRTKNLAVYLDDIQDEKQQQALYENIFVTTEGMEGGRLNPDASYKQRLEWQSLVVVCSNASFIDYLTRKQKSTTAGMRRVFEIEHNKIPDEKGLINPITASLVFAKLERNFGCMGALYAQFLAREHKMISKLVIDVTDRFRTLVDGTSDESFWWGLCGLLLTGGLLARKMEVAVDIDVMEDFLVKAFKENRRLRREEGTEGGSLLNTEQAITSFLNHFLGNGNVIYTGKKFEHREIPIAVLASPNAGKPIYIQVIRDARIVLISKRAFRKFLEDNDVRPRQVFAGMAEFFGAKESKHTLGAGTPYPQTQELCLEFVIPMGPGIFNEMIAAHGAPETRPYLVPGTTRDPGGT